MEPTKLEIFTETEKDNLTSMNVHINNNRGYETFPNSNNVKHKTASKTDLEQASLPLLNTDTHQTPPSAEQSDAHHSLRVPYAHHVSTVSRGVTYHKRIKDENASNYDEIDSGDDVVSVGGDSDFYPRFHSDGRPFSAALTSAPDVNTYQQKKNLAQGMMDLALLSANANQLRYVLESSTAHPYYYSSLTLISLSIVFQITVGVGLIMNSRFDVNDKKEIYKADKINNMTVLGIFLITTVNVFIASFSVSTPMVTEPTTAIVPLGPKQQEENIMIPTV